jgi:RNA polymerase sigma-70 factor (ECF subfamily)
MQVPAKTATFDSADLAYQVASKNTEAFSYLYDIYSPALFGYIKQQVKCSRNAEEILHDVFVKIWNNTDTYCSSKTSYFTWIMAIAKTKTNDYLRNKEAKIEPLLGVIV